MGKNYTQIAQFKLLSIKFIFWVKKNPANMGLNNFCQEKLSGPQLDLHKC